MSISPVAPLSSPQAGSSADPRNAFRTKTVGTRLSISELEEVEAAAKRAGKTLAEWLREVALRAARPSPDVNELLLAEVAATRYMLLNLFDASAKAAERNENLPPEDVLRIRDAADSRKRATAQKLLQEFMGPSVPAAQTGGAR